MDLYLSGDNLVRIDEFLKIVAERFCVNEHVNGELLLICRKLHQSVRNEGNNCH